MVVLPIVSRELLVASRRQSLYRLRVTLGVLTVGLGAFFLVVGENSTVVPSNAAGRTLFLVISVLLFAGAIAAAHGTYDCISEEKREGTMGFLFLTDLSGFDIVLGKLFAAALPSFYGMMAALPALMSAVLMGGVTGREVWQTSLAALNFFFFGQSAAILASTLSRKRAAAAQSTALILGFFIAGLGIIGALARHPVWFVESFNPAFTFATATHMGGVSGSEGGFWLSLATVNWVGWLFLLVASLALPRVWQARVKETKFVAASHTGSAVANENPFDWLLSRRLGRPQLIWESLVALVALAFSALAITHVQSGWRIIAAMAIPAVLLKIWLATLTGRVMEDSRRDGSLEILLACTALTEKEIFQGQARALRRLFVGPTLAVVALDIIAICFVKDTRIRLMILGSILALPVDLMTLASLAAWFALRQKKAGRAGFTAFFWVCVFPGFFFAAPIIVAGPAASFSESFYCLLMVGFFVDGILLSLTREKLLIHLRALSKGTSGNARPIGLFEELTAQERMIVLRS